VRITNRASDALAEREESRFERLRRFETGERSLSGGGIEPQIESLAE
jgi:hypothetical protein